MRRILSPCLSRMIPGNPGYAHGTDSANTAGHVLVRVSELPQQDWQKSVVFPDWKGYTDDTLAMNSMLSFRFSHGQGVIWLQVDEAVEAFTLYITRRRVTATIITELGEVLRLRFSRRTRSLPSRALQA